MMTHKWQPYSQTAVEIMSGELRETLFIVTSDHGHTMSFAGYPARGTDIRGRGRLNLIEEFKGWLPDSTQVS